MKATEIEYPVLKLKGAAVLIDAMGCVSGTSDDDKAAAAIISDAIRAANEELEDLIEK